eukprot:CAMPEP_0184295290 /NCGR_PEP_ID=MMETSP1049-20130417/6182_1 /TAXON_ID=77928 /ORGANISM="Proteomonas sulcata, Strain CCMP704" /LENGTH=475 /DNA_ID=CAMNT_0026603759 /DNA_START=68 /DNA_END=1492 /DNA_ORIENTATION=-
MRDEDADESLIPEESGVKVQEAARDSKPGGVPEDVEDSDEISDTTLINNFDRTPWKPLEREVLNASKAGDVAQLKRLVAQGADPNAKERSILGFHAIHYAVKGSHHLVVDFLLSKGADLNSMSGEPYGVLHYAAELDSGRLAQKFISLGVNTSVEGFGYETPLYNAIEKGKIAPFEVLLDNGADVNHTDRWHTAPLHKAAMFGRPDMIERLCKAGAYVEEMDWASRTPLQVAAEHGEDACCEVLLDWGADLGSCAENGKNALEWAEWRNRKSTIRLLRRASGMDSEPSEDELDALEPVEAVKSRKGRKKDKDIMEDENASALAAPSSVNVTSTALTSAQKDAIKSLIPATGLRIPASEIDNLRSWAQFKRGRQLVIKSGKRKGLSILTNQVGKIITKSADLGVAIGRPSNAMVNVLRNKQCRADNCTRTAYFGHPRDMIRRFCQYHRRMDDVDVYEKADPTPNYFGFGGGNSAPW